MAKKTWDLVEHLVTSVRAKDPSERAGFLDGIEEYDESLRKEVESRLASLADEEEAENDGDLQARFQRLSTALVADAVIRLGLPPKIASTGIRAVATSSKFAGPASPVVLNGYADSVLEGIYRSEPGDVLVLDNKNRPDEACFGDLAAYEAKTQGLAGVIIWGRHRDTGELSEIGVPLFSYGTYPLGMQRVFAPVDERFARCQFGDVNVERGEIVFADDDGVLFVPAEHVDSVLTTAEELRSSEQAQVDRIRAGTTLREQLDFDEYLREKERHPDLTLGEHMKKRGRHF
jgi:regulator of RNase E activity RraA